ncbi:hypothetical protein GNT65_08735 [Shewanella sp. JBTF-M18]|uniref:Uncharacterized protein n=1 Tax=Shewanella insulae TaxID=2681496 RepID=A0A6L7HWY3_9GAMM|nr:hypothetical protein [Shewanella insulae]MXR68755.1 hypothetical protein [Shewanella insulae]
MELKDFIKEAIKDISEAISESNSELSEIGAIVNPERVYTSGKDEELYGYMLKNEETDDFRRPVHSIEFDVAVSTLTKKDGKEGVGVNVVGISLGKDSKQADENNSSSRLQFSIPVAMPTGKN